MAGELVKRSVELFHSGAWEDISADALNRDGSDPGPMRITHGVSNRSGSTNAGNLRLTLNNGTSEVNPAVSQRYSLRNPLSDLYDVLNANLPVRLSAGLLNATPHVGATNFDVTDTSSSHVAPSVDSPTAEALLLCAWAAPSPSQSYTLPGSMTASASSSDSRTTMDSASEAISSAGATGTRTATFSASDDYVAGSVLLHGSSMSVADTAGFTDEGTIATAVAGNWLVLATYMSTVEGVRRLIFPDGPQDTDGGGWIPLGDTGAVDMSDTNAELARLRLWAKRVRTSGSVTVSIDNPNSSLESIVSVLWEVSGAAEWHVRMVAETVALPPRRDVSNRDLWTPVQAAGVLRRLGTRGSPLAPAATTASRTLADPQGEVVACWPLAGLGQDVRAAPSALTGQPPITVRPTVGPGGFDFGVTWSADSTAPGLGAMPSVRTEDTSVGFTGQVPPVSALRPWGWSVWGRATDGAAQITHWVDTESTKWLIWIIWTNTVAFLIHARDSENNIVASLFNTVDIPLTDRWFNFAAIVDQVGSDADLTVLLDGVEIAMTLDTGSLNNLTVGTPQQTRPTASLNTGGQSVSIGYPSVFAALTDTTAGIIASIQELNTAGRGYDGEPAGRRVQRLCAQRGVAFTATGDLDATASMGPQHPRALVDELDEAAKLEAGNSPAPTLVEQQQAAGLHFNTIAALSLPRAPDLTLDFADAQLWEPFEPTPDDQNLVNDATASRRGGGEARVQVFDGRKGITRAGRKDAAESFAAVSDQHLDGLARYWTLHGTWDADRYPVIRINVRALSTRTGGDALVAAALALREGALLRLTNLPADVSAEDQDLMVLGITEPVRTEQWLLDLHVAPAAPFTVAVLEDGTVGILQSDSATLDEALDTTETAVDIDAGAGPDWVHDGVDYDITIGGERMTVTAVGAMSGTFPARKATLTVTRSVNGITKTHSAGAKVEWATKAYIGLWG